MPPGMSLLLTFLSASLYALSFPPFSLSFLAWIALIPLLYAASRTSPLVAAMCGLLWAIGAAYGVGWWFPGMVTNYLQLSLTAGWAAFFSVSVGLAGIYFACFTAWVSWLARRQSASPWLIAAGWSVCEFARANLLIGNPWALSGYSQVSHPWLMQIADATGPYGVGLLIATVNASIAGIFSPVLRGRRPLVSTVCVVVAFGLVCFYGHWRMSQTFTVGDPIPIAVVQGAIEQKLRWQPEYRKANLDRYLALTQGTTASHPQLIFWPEYAVDFHLQVDSPLRESVFQVTRDLKADLILGGQYYSYGVSDVELHNSVFLVHHGRLAGRYDKMRLLPFAEANQVERFFPNLPSRYVPGQFVQVLRAPAARIGAFLCIEAVYPDVVKSFVRKGAEILANPSNDGWFGGPAPARLQLHIALVRAIENRRYLVRATTTGISAVIDPYGRIVAASDFGSPAVLTALIYRSHTRTPYQHWGDALCWIALATVLIASFSCVLR
jgi:apolipoprotein N-acyltransferase